MNDLNRQIIDLKNLRRQPKELKTVDLPKNTFEQAKVKRLMKEIFECVRSNDYKDNVKIVKSWDNQLQCLAHELYPVREYRLLFKSKFRELLYIKIKMMK